METTDTAWTPRVGTPPVIEADCQCCGLPPGMCEQSNDEEIPLALVAGW